MTFLLTTNPDIRSVKLLGSWDNFSKPYSMERDRRVGPGYWRGCFQFTDIMADGSHDHAQWRADGLKMGCTYWYYYILNENIEFYNENEKFTTKCPLLPGRPLNILNVPMVLPKNRIHGRSSSDGSQSEEYRTLHPEDKFMNPRRPPKPELAHIQTTNLNPRQPSPGNLAPSPVGVHRINGAQGRPPRARAFSEAQNQENQRQQLIQHQQMIQQQQQQQQQQQAENTVAERRNVPGILVHASSVKIPMNSVDQPAGTTIQARRALKGNAGNAAPALHLLSVDTHSRHRRPSTSQNEAQGPAPVVKAKASNDMIVANGQSSSGSGDMPTPTGPDIQHKRLPSLPNSPSSVMDEAVRAIDERDKAADALIMRSHFSSMTIDESINSRIEQSRFSEWSTDTGETEDETPASIFSASTFHHEPQESSAPEDWTTPDLSCNDAATNTDPNTPHLTANSKPCSPNSATADMPPWNGTLPEFAMDEVESNPKRHAALFDAIESMQALSLAQSPSASPIFVSESDRSKFDSHSRQSDASAVIRGKATMQELMDELAYLKNMMQSNMEGEPF
ncbi:hypothetical protein N7470_003894 [Penicillium chermesinum]|nr:hypothetical protein N7470_003894 [Penicillium chermesinum]